MTDWVQFSRGVKPPDIFPQHLQDRPCALVGVELVLTHDLDLYQEGPEVRRRGLGEFDCGAEGGDEAALGIGVFRFCYPGEDGGAADAAFFRFLCGLPAAEVPFDFSAFPVVTVDGGAAGAGFGFGLGAGRKAAVVREAAVPGSSVIARRVRDVAIQLRVLDRHSAALRSQRRGEGATSAAAATPRRARRVVLWCSAAIDHP
jgi:hypothetical protein